MSYALQQHKHGEGWVTINEDVEINTENKKVIQVKLQCPDEHANFRVIDVDTKKAVKGQVFFSPM